MAGLGVGINNNVGVNTAEVNFKGKPKESTNDSPKTSHKMSTGMKVGLGATALAAIVVGGLLFKQGNKFIKNALGEIEDLGKKVEEEKVFEYAKNMVKGFTHEERKVMVSRLDENGLQELFSDGAKDIKSFLGKKDGVLVSILDKDSNPVGKKTFIADTLSEDLIKLFGDESHVQLT